MPSSTYAARDGHVFIVVGNDRQWRRLVEIPKFASLAGAHRATIEGRKRDREALWRELAAIAARFGVAEIVADLERAGLVHAVIRDLREVHALDHLRGRMTRTELPDGTPIGMQPKAVEVPGTPARFALAPRYAEHTRGVLAEAGYDAAACDALEADGVIA